MKIKVCVCVFSGYGLNVKISIEFDAPRHVPQRATDKR